MKLKDYIKDNIINITIYLVTLIILFLFFRILKLSTEAFICTYIILFLCGILLFFYNYNRKRKFYNELTKQLENLDKKYIITELIEKPNFLEGQIFYNSLYEINKTMNEEIKKYKLSLEEFKEYIEMWVHEVKLPLSSILLMTYKKDDISKVIEPTKRIENFVEQVLYYARSENAEKDYIIKECDLKEIISKVIKKNKEIFILEKIEIKLERLDNKKVLSDSKWLEFIINQIISNSLKYVDKEKSIITISTSENEKNIILKIQDNGIGIPKSDIKKVFDKSFTGENGRKIQTSTGMGLYIAKQLCEKLGHKIEIESEQNKYTSVFITFSKDQFYNILK
ncbi:MAG: sensor histidine kinase [Clostridia bacterium]|nr:sensor histidine kinase [Clostridium sp.]